MHRYECPACGLLSEPFWRRSQAEEKGATHRHNRHDNMHPKGEGIVTEVFHLPGRGELTPVVIVVALVLAGLVSKFW